MTNALRAALIAFLVQGVSAPRETTASVEGIVVEASSQRPVAGAVVELTGLAATRDFKVLSFFTRTSNNGRFILEGIPPGNAYQLVATRAPDFIPAVHGQNGVNDPWVPIALTAGLRMSGIRLVMVELAGVSGRVVDKNGNGVRSVLVAALNLSYRDGWRLLESNKVVRTNELGEYRIPGLARGRYVIRIGPLNRRSSAESAYLYFPDTMNPDKGVPVEVSERTTAEAVNFLLPETETLRVRGRVIEQATGKAVRDTRVFLVPPKLSPDSSAAREITSRDGDFEFRGVMPGKYQLFATTRDSSRSMSGRTPIEVNDIDLKDITLEVRSDFEVFGRLTIEDPNRAALLDFSQAVVTLNAASRGTIDAGLSGLTPENQTDSAVPPLRAKVNPDGTFAFKGVRTWTYFAEADLTGAAEPLSRFYVKSVMLGGVPMLSDAEPFGLSGASNPNILLGADSGTLDGRVVDENRHGMAHAVAVLVPDEPLRARRDLYRSAQTDATGRFRVVGIAPGSYKVFAWRGVDPGAWYFAEFLKNGESRSVPAVIRPAEATTVDVPLISDNPHLR